jgi:RNA polymerase sigma-70 factor (ECF subfamily)
VEQRLKVRRPGTDERLLIEAAQQDPGRFAELYERNFGRVYAYVARRTGSRAEAEDVVSDVFHQALKNLGSFEWRGVPFAAWLLRIAANALADRGRQAARERGNPAADPAEISQPEIERTEAAAQLFRLVESLPADQRRVVEMRFAGEKSIREIASALGRTEGAIKQLQFRALRNLRERMDRKDG